jgi:regulator of sigma E protease
MASLVGFIIVLGVLIFVHELGHFLVAKGFGVRVLKFSLGFGPKLVGRKRGETDYIISLVPLGGYVKMLGEEEDGEKVSDPAHAFCTQPVLRRFAIVCAGPASNILFAVILATSLYMVGYPTLIPAIGEVREGSPAALAGLQTGDLISRIDGRPIDEWNSLREFVHARPGEELLFTVMRGERQLSFRITPRLQETHNIFGEAVRVGLIGVAPAGEVIARRYSPHVAVGKGFAWTGGLLKLIVVSVVKMVQGKVSADNLAGPLGIAQMAGETYKSGLLVFISFLAFVSVSLGILNLLPVPVLDGGHIIFIGIEAVRGKPVDIRKREIAQQVGLALLLSLMVLAFYNDVMRFLH